MRAPVTHSSQIAETRRIAVGEAKSAGFDEAATARIALVATEMATNLLKHAGTGEIIIGTYADNEGTGLELLALDKGKGIADVSRSLEDGYSSAGSPGSGLGAIRRQSDRFAIWSRPGLGTAVMARFDRGGGRAAGLTIGAVVDPVSGEAASGDGWSFTLARAGPTLLLLDGSGHGIAAAAALEAGRAAFCEHAEYDCLRLMEAVHRALAPTRGAAAAIARIDARQQLVRFVGVGNILGTMVVDGVVRRMISHNGIAGHVAPRIREFTYPWLPGATIVLHSDGLSAKWDFSAYPGLATSHPSLLAGILFRDHRRPKDDASVVVMAGTP
jgi:anti-sigma regulatory factor (Ser/Thr protein kinase)